MPRRSRAVASPARTAVVAPTSTTVPSSTTTACPSASEPAAGSSTAAVRRTIRPSSSAPPSDRSRLVGRSLRPSPADPYPRWHQTSTHSIIRVTSATVGRRHDRNQRHPRAGGPLERGRAGERRRAPPGPPGRPSLSSGRGAMGGSISLTNYSWPDGLAPSLGRVVEAADRAGLDTFWVADHLVQADPTAPPDDTEMLEAYTTLGFLAARTERVRLGTMVTGVTFRPPALLVKAVTTLDVLTGGRAWLGIGVGYHGGEASAMGLPLPPAAERVE